jgi:hypothetical protein
VLEIEKSSYKGEISSGRSLCRGVVAPVAAGTPQNGSLVAELVATLNLKRSEIK